MSNYDNITRTRASEAKLIRGTGKSATDPPIELYGGDQLNKPRTTASIEQLPCYKKLVMIFPVIYPTINTQTETLPHRS